jgi:hypothetical protein
MKHKIEFGFGVGQDADGNPIDQLQFVFAFKVIRLKAVDLFGGYTMCKTTGGWIDPTGRLVEEPGYTLFVFSDFNEFEKYRMMAEIIKTELNQQAVAVTVTEVNFEIL